MKLNLLPLIFLLLLISCQEEEFPSPKDFPIVFTGEPSGNQILNGSLLMPVNPSGEIKTSFVIEYHYWLKTRIDTLDAPLDEDTGRFSTNFVQNLGFTNQYQINGITHMALAEYDGKYYAGERKKSNLFILPRPLKIDSIYPTTGRMGDTLTIHGKNFNGRTEPWVTRTIYTDASLPLLHYCNDSIRILVPPRQENVFIMNIFVRVDGLIASLYQGFIYLE